MNIDEVNNIYAHTGYWLRRLSDSVHLSFERALSEYDLTVSQWMVIVTLYHYQDASPNQIAKYIDIDPAAITRLLDRLEKKQLIQRMQDPKDRRSLKLKLTVEGRALVPRLTEIADQNDEKFFHILSTEEHTQLKSLLIKLLAPVGIDATRDWK